MKDPKHISEMTDIFLKKIQKKEKETQEIFHIEWGKVVGKELSLHSKIIGYSNKKLIVSVENSSYLFSISLVKENALKKIKKEHSSLKIDDIKLVINGG